MSFRAQCEEAIAHYSGDGVISVALEGDSLILTTKSNMYTLSASSAGRVQVFGPEGVQEAKAGVLDVIARVIKNEAAAASRKSSSESSGSELSSNSDDFDDDDDDEDENKEFLMGSQGSMFDDEDMAEFAEVELNSNLVRDVEALRRFHGADSVALAHQIYNDQVTDLFIIPGFLSQRVCEAWGVDRFMPVRIRLLLDASAYMRGEIPVPQVEQDRGGLPLGIASHLESIIKTFLREQWDNFRDRGFVYLQDTKGAVGDPRMEQLLAMGFGAQLCRNALLLHGSVEEAANALVTDPKLCASQKLPASLQFRVDASQGLLANLYTYLMSRFPKLHMRCVICDQQFKFGAPMLKPAVCSRAMCSFAFQELGLMSDSADGLATQAEVVDLLVCMAQAAAKSSRAADILNPFPTVYEEGNEVAVLDPEKPDYKLASTVLSSISLKTMAQAETQDAMQQHASHPLAVPMLSWIVSSNRCHLVKLDRAKHIPQMATPMQYIMLSAPPEVEEEFARLKNQYGSLWAFHGSRGENWHSILRNGLKNVSNTKLMLNGAAHGAGIYMATTASYSLGYSQLRGGSAAAKSEQVGRWIDPTKFNCIALCETINNPELRKSGTIWVQPKDGYVVTRFLFVYQAGSDISQATKAVSTDSGFIANTLAAMAE